MEKRADEVKHGLVVVGFLENWIEPESGELGQKLRVFYAGLRRRMIEVQAKQSAELLEELIAEVLAIREIWQMLDASEAAAGPEILPPIRAQKVAEAFSAQSEQRRSNWSA